MSNADRLFEKLGYRKENNPQLEIRYIKNRNNIIRFWKPEQRIIKQNEDGLYMGIEIEELQAINEKIKELGWNKE